VDKKIARSIDAIATNYHSGAAEVAAQGAEVFLQCARHERSVTLEDFRQELLEVGYALIHAHPAMAPLVNLVNTLLWNIDASRSLQAMQRTVVDVAMSFKHQIHIREAAIAELVLTLIPEKARIVTISRSTTVQAALRHAQHAGRRFSVVCAEGRPGYEGRTMASELNEYGVAVTVVIDALAISMAAEADLVLVGSDHVRDNELVNKVGTYGLALAAQASNVPMYALCGSSKFLPPGYHLPHQVKCPPEQVWNEPPSQVKVQNLYFDHTPLSYLAGIVTEKGVLPTVGIEAWLASIKLHPTLEDI